MDRRPAVLVVAAWVLLSTAAGLYSLHRLWQRSAAESDAENGARSSEQVESGGRPAVEPDGESGDSFLACLDAAPPGVHPRALETQNREALVLERMSRGVRSAAGERWRPIGSTNLASPTMAASIVPGQEDVALACGLGGIWLGALRGSETWRCVGSGLGHGAHALVATNADPLSIVSITREGRVQATTDGGSTWFMPGGLPDQILGCVRLLPDPSDASVVWLLVRGRIWTGNQLPTGYHLCCSRDGGTTFAVVHSEPDWPPCDIWTGRTGAAPLFLLCGESLKRSMRAGADFTEVGRIAGAGSGQGEAIEGVALTGSEAGAPTLYASLSRGGRWMLHRSIDGGRSWEPRAALPRFSATLCASIRDPDLLLLGGGRCLRSVDGGRTFLPLETEAADRTGGAGLPQGTVHGIDCFWIAGREVILLHTEGGSFASVDAASTFQDLAGKGLCAGTYYATLTSPGDPYLILAASEGQGMQRSKSRLRSKSMTETTDGMGPASFAGMLDFEPLVAGRFLQIVSADPDSSPVWALAREHLLVLEDPHAGPSSRRSVPFPAGSDARAGAFLAIDPTDRSTVHLCANGLWSCRREAAGLWSWTPDRRIRAPGRLAVFAIAAADPSFRYAAEEDGSIWYSHDEGRTWTRSSAEGPRARAFRPAAIAVAERDARIAFLGGSGYGGPAVYATADGGVTWTPRGDGLPPTAVLGLAFCGPEDRSLFAAAEAGAFRLDLCGETSVLGAGGGASGGVSGSASGGEGDDASGIDARAGGAGAVALGGGRWDSILRTEGPLAGFRSVEAVPDIGVVRFTTAGRGIWDYSVGDPRLADVDGGGGAGAGGNAVDPSVPAFRPTFYPNPAEERTSLIFDLPKGGMVRIEMFEICGRKVRTILEAERSAGRQSIEIELVDASGRRLLKGTYLIRAEGPAGVWVGKLRVLREQLPSVGPRESPSARGREDQCAPAAYALQSSRCPTNGT